MIEILGKKFEILSGDYGVNTVKADELNDLMCGLGYLHAKERGLQMLTNRIVFSGRLCELLKDLDETLKIDILMHSLNLIESSERDLTFLDDEAKEFLEAYCDGVNGYFQKQGRPWPHKLLRVKYEKWLPVHTLALMKLSTFMGLAQSQIELETLIIELIQKDASFDKIKSLFSPYIKDYDLENLDRIKSANFDHDYSPQQLPFDFPNIGMYSSNNWAIASKKSAEGGPIHCFDPHLDCLRIPTMWYEAKLQLKEKEFAGITVAGIPGIIMGKSPTTAMTFTYGYMDMVDFYIEEVKNGEYLFEKTYLEIKEKKRIIKRKKNDDLEILFLQGAAGPLWIDPQKIESPLDLEDGYYFSWAWSGQNGVHATVSALRGFFEAETAKDLQSHIKKVSFSCNWIITDNDDNLIYQQTGRFPKRKAEGLLPLPAWKQDNLWNGMQELDQLMTVENPESGFISTANNYINKDDSNPVINACKGNYRNDRISEILEKNNKITVDDMKTLQTDNFSIRAQKALKILLPLLPVSPLVVNLKGWDFRFDNNSKTPHLFEEIMFRLGKELFGRTFFGAQNWEHIIFNTPNYGNFHERFDRVLLRPTPEEEKFWFGELSHEEWLKQALKKIIKELTIEEFQFKKWKEFRTFTVENSLLPPFMRKWFKLDSEPTIFSGCPDAVNQSTVMQRGSFKISSAASFRGIINHSKGSMITILPGGNSEKKGKHYLDQLRMWELGKYKKIF